MTIIRMTTMMIVVRRLRRTAGKGLELEANFGLMEER